MGSRANATSAPAAAQRAVAGAESPSPTADLYAALERAFAHFNERLFGGALPPALLTLRGTRHARGYHHAERFIAPDGRRVHELALHPGFFTVQPIEWSLATLVHEMVHHWQTCFGKPSRSNAHNREWAAKMRALGLPPSKTGLPGGAEVGRRVTHWIDPEGAFIVAARELIDQGFAWPWMDRHVPEDLEHFERYTMRLAERGVQIETAAPPPWQALPDPLEAPSERDDGAQGPQAQLVRPNPPRPRADVRMTCPGCGIRVRMASEASLICADCDRPLEVVV